MLADQLMRVAEFAIVILVAAGAIGLLFWLTRRPRRDGDLVIGYPPDLYPVHGVTQSPALLTLAATQRRLCAVYERLPVAARASSPGDAALWLRVFLLELRGLMDAAYRVAVVADVYGQSGHLDRLVAEVAQLEAQVADDLARRLLSHDGPARNEVLNRRLASLRDCARELTALETARPPAEAN